MNPKKLKKMIKRQTDKKRAQRQTGRRTERISIIMNKRQVAQDIYESLQGLRGEPKRRRNGGEYSLRVYDYDMFNFGDPIKVGKASPAASTNRHSREMSEIKKEQRRKIRWGLNIKLTKEDRKKAKREERKRRKREDVKRVKRTTSRKVKTG
ncbi:MAG: hypothetical protein V1875_07730 [Candidatus Altiarchaeota archaeon]